MINNHSFISLSLFFLSISFADVIMPYHLCDVIQYRAKVDRWNSYVGSGLVSALLRMDEGPIGVAQGFVVGVGFFYLIDQMMPNNPTLNAPNPNEMAVGKGLKGKPRPMKIGTPQPRAGGRMVRM